MSTNVNSREVLHDRLAQPFERTHTFQTDPKDGPWKMHVAARRLTADEVACVVADDKKAPEAKDSHPERLLVAEITLETPDGTKIRPNDLFNVEQIPIYIRAEGGAYLYVSHGRLQDCDLAFSSDRISLENAQTLKNLATLLHELGHQAQIYDRDLWWTKARAVPRAEIHGIWFFPYSASVENTIANHVQEYPELTELARLAYTQTDYAPTEAESTLFASAETTAARERLTQKVQRHARRLATKDTHHAHYTLDRAARLAEWVRIVDARETIFKHPTKILERDAWRRALQATRLLRIMRINVMDTAIDGEKDMAAYAKRCLETYGANWGTVSASTQGTVPPPLAIKDPRKRVFLPYSDWDAYQETGGGEEDQA